MENNKYVVACVNGMPFSESVCDYSTWFAGKLNLKLKLFHSLDHASQEVTSDLSGQIGIDANDELLSELVSIEHERNKLLQRRGNVVLERAKRRTERRGAVDPKICLQHGNMTENLNALKEKIELVVIGRYGQKHILKPEKAVGHKVESVIRTLEIPIVVVSQPFSEPKSVLLAFDGSNNSKKALNYIIESCAFTGLEIHVVYVGAESQETSSFLNDAVAKLKSSGYNTRSEHLSGSTDEALINYINTHDIGITAMGAFGHHWLRKLLVGSFTSKILSLSERPLLLIR